MMPSTEQAPCSLLRGIRIERGTVADWRRLAPLHYRSHHAGAITDVFRMVYGPLEDECGARRAQRAARSAECGADGNSNGGTGDSGLGTGNSHGGSPLTFTPHSALHVPRLVTLHSALRAPHSDAPRSAFRAPRLDVLVGVIVYSRSPLSLAARNHATGGRYRVGGSGRAALGDLINRELRIISRVVIAPNWRGLGLGPRLVRETLARVGTPYVEALAAMGHMSAFFERAGMTAYPQPPAPQGERLRAALESVGIDRMARRSARSLAEALDALDGGAPHLAPGEYTGGAVLPSPLAGEGAGVRGPRADERSPSPGLRPPSPIEGEGTPRRPACVHKGLDGRGPAARRFIEHEIARWARSYLAAKNHRLNEVPRERLLDLVARHLDSAPVYYLWQNPNPTKGEP